MMPSPIAGAAANTPACTMSATSDAAVRYQRRTARTALARTTSRSRAPGPRRSRRGRARRRPTVSTARTRGAAPRTLRPERSTACRTSTSSTTTTRDDDAPTASDRRHVSRSPARRCGPDCARRRRCSREGTANTAATPGRAQRRGEREQRPGPRRIGRARAAPRTAGTTTTQQQVGDQPDVERPEDGGEVSCERCASRSALQSGRRDALDEVALPEQEDDRDRQDRQHRARHDQRVFGVVLAR